MVRKDLSNGTGDAKEGVVLTSEIKTGSLLSCASKLLLPSFCFGQRCPPTTVHLLALLEGMKKHSHVTKEADLWSECYRGKFGFAGLSCSVKTNDFRMNAAHIDFIYSPNTLTLYTLGLYLHLL